MLPINTNASAVIDLIYSLKIRDAMSRDIVTIPRDATLRQAQDLMKEKGISGIPVAEERRILGLITISDIFDALNLGYIDNKVRAYMTRNVTLLEEDMPLSFGITYFERFHFGRFPVINRDKELVGILTSRDILSKLLVEINNEINRLEAELINKQESRGMVSDDHFYREYVVRRFDFETAGKGSMAIKKELKARNVPRSVVRKIAVASYELEINIAVHSDGGRLTFTYDGEKVLISAIDDGPGIADVEQVLQVGYSTATEWVRSLGFGAGMGLPNVKRVSDSFSIESEVGKGTKVTSTIFLQDRGDAGEKSAEEKEKMENEK